MIIYGIACLVVCALSLMHRPAMPFALILSAGWILGFGPVEVWWLISLAEAAVFAAMLTHRAPTWQVVTAMCVPIMLMADAHYWLNDFAGHYVGDFYANTLNVLFAIQLAAVGYPGGRRLVKLGITLLRSGRYRWRMGGRALDLPSHVRSKSRPSENSRSV